MSNQLPSVGRIALADHVRNAIYENLLNLRIAPGGRINIEAVAQQLQVSPTPVREALARLEAEELVVKRSMAGYVAGPLMTVPALANLIDLRLQIEPWLARLAASVEDAGLRGSIVEVLSSTDAADRKDPAIAATLDAAMHDRIALLAGNTSARQALQRLNSQFHIYRFLSTNAIVPDPIREHRTLVRAIAAGESREAQARMREHLAETRALIFSANT